MNNKEWKGGDAYGTVPERILAPPPLKVRGARGVIKLDQGFAEGKRTVPGPGINVNVVAQFLGQAWLSGPVGDKPRPYGKKM